ncbi:hypothetical protein C487_12131 [Natrinema pallidum DSM 3751]|uniref:Uncharacterized protein n=2 Tax=Natrinema pallidum TaxID=69527 RepID=L9YRA2_9EURY|nr:hypothetical protein C487_12131 [Natrinema pallidum DSM 3751]
MHRLSVATIADSIETRTGGTQPADSVDDFADDLEIDAARVDRDPDAETIERPSRTGRAGSTFLRASPVRSLEQPRPMATQDTRPRGGFVSFFRDYTKTWVHAVATAGLTAFGTLAVFHRGFIALALATYIVPPIALYLWRPSAGRTDGDTAAEGEGDAAIAGGGGPPLERTGAGDGPAAAGEDDRDADWHLVDVPTDATLRDVCVTDAGAVYAVGENGLVLAGAPVDGADTGAWSIVLEDGPAAAGDELTGVDATDGGEAVWVAGDSGSLGRLEAETGRHTDYTAPADSTDNWVGVAVGGTSGDETVLLITGSGTVLRGRYRDGKCAWDDPITPGSGASLSAIALADASVGYCCDTNDSVFETTDGGHSFDRVGLDGADGTLEALATLGRGDCLVSDDDGVVHRYGGSTWTPDRVGDEAICGIARREGETIACDADGVLYERTRAAGWDRVGTQAPDALIAVSTATTGERAVAVGEKGTVVERR